MSTLVFTDMRMKVRKRLEIWGESRKLKKLTPFLVQTRENRFASCLWWRILFICSNFCRYFVCLFVFQIENIFSRSPKLKVGLQILWPSSDADSAQPLDNALFWGHQSVQIVAVWYRTLFLHFQKTFRGRNWTGQLFRRRDVNQILLSMLVNRKCSILFYCFQCEKLSVWGKLCICVLVSEIIYELYF